MSGTDLNSDPLLANVPVHEGYRVLGGVVLYQKLGKGGMGAVYRGHHLRLDIDVALKVMAEPAGLSEEQAGEFLRRFLREARTAAAVKHQNLVRVYDVSSDCGLHYLVMEYVDGESAAERLKRKGDIAEQEAVEIASGAAGGLAAAHRKGIVHRDVKPDNILIGKEGDVVVADLGLAKAFSGQEENAPSMLTQTHTAMGTPFFMAPEQFASARDVSPAADVWSLGVALYQLLTSELPWTGSSVFLIAEKIRGEPAPDPRTTCLGLSDGVCRIVEKALCKNPAERYVDCAEMGDALRGHLDSIRTSRESVLPDKNAGTTSLAPLSVAPPARDIITRIEEASLGKEKSADSAEDPGAAWPFRAASPKEADAVRPAEMSERTRLDAAPLSPSAGDAEPPRETGGPLSVAPTAASPREPDAARKDAEAGEATQQYIPPPGEGHLPTKFLRGAEVVDERRLGSLGRVLVVKRPQGAAAEKWSGRERLLLRELAAEEGESEESIRLLREDAAALAGVEHAGIVRVIGLLRRGDDEFVALDYPSGKELPALISRQEIDPDRATSLACRCASGLGELVRRGRPHRDFRSSCVFVSEDDAVQILPVACPAEFRVEKRVAEGGVYHGLARYAAPELHSSGGGNPTEKSNIFAFGVVLYEMLTGQTPFVGGTPSRVLMNIQEAQPSPPSAVNKAVTDKLDRICLRCLEKDPERRQENFAVLEVSLRVASVRSVSRQAPQQTPPGASLLGPRSSKALRSQIAQQPETGGPSRAAVLTTGGPSSIAVEPRTAAMRVPSGRTSLSRAHKGVLAAVALFVLAGVGLVAVWGLAGESEGERRARRSREVFAQAEKLVSLDRHEAALGLIEAHAAIRPCDPERYDRLFRQAYLAHWRRRSARAEGDGRWSDAEKAFTALLKHETGARREAARTRLAEAAYRATVAAADSAMAGSEWDAAVEALEKAERLASGAGGAYRATMPELVRLRAELAFARSLRDAGLARAEGDEAGERRHLLATARQRPDHDATAGRLRELGADPRAAEEALARARKTLGAGDLDATERFIKEAARLWPLDELPPRLLAYLADRRSIEGAGMAFVSDSDPFVAWGPDERARAFGIDRYEFPGVAGKMPRTSVTWVEAARACRGRGGRLCTLAEWQLAAGGPKRMTYPYGNEYDAGAANTQGTGLAASGSFKRDGSPFGVYDMSGNAGEWTADERDGGRVVAGGDWSSGAERSKSTSFIVFGAELTSRRVGFRCCRSLDSDTADKDGRDEQDGRGR